ncbi:hypothetical protein B7486_00045 [cyanobacterium TDX16]|nr:hypothetical protein B7486_00045 [cyanobacterium TDX16]
MGYLDRWRPVARFDGVERRHDLGNADSQSAILDLCIKNISRMSDCQSLSRDGSERNPLL